MREQVSQGKKGTNVSIPTLKQPTRGFGLNLSETSSPAVETEPINQPASHDISKISPRPQAKLSISQPGDFYERQADSIAHQVMRRIAQPPRQYVQPQQSQQEEQLQLKPLANFISPLVQRQQAPEEEELQMKSANNSTSLQRQQASEEGELQMKSVNNSTSLQRQQVPEEDEEVQMKSVKNSTALQRQQAPEEHKEVQMKPMVQRRPSAARMTASSDLETSIQKSRGGGQPLADDIKQPMEQAFGADFSSIRIHTDAQSHQLNKSIQSRAFTTGQDIFFRQGEYSPGSNAGKELLAHELTHVIQQNGSAIQRKSLHLLPKENKLQTKHIPDSGEAIQMRESPQKLTEGNSEKKTDEVEVKTDTVEIKQQNQNTPQKQQTASTSPVEGGNPAGDSPPTKKDEVAVESSQNPSSNQKQPQDNQQTQPELKDTKANTKETSPQVEGQDKGKLPRSAAELSTGKASQLTANVSASNLANTAGNLTEAAVDSATVVDDGQKAPTSPEQDPAFQAVVNTTTQVARNQKKHPPANKKASEAQAAAEPPGNEVDSKAQANQVGEMEQAQTPSFDTVAFKAKLMERIADMAPKNLEEADDFKNNNKLDSVKGDLTGKVKEEQTATQEPLEQKTKEKPDTSAIEAKQVTPLAKTDPGTSPSSLGADQAAPKSKGQSEVEAPLQTESQKLDQQMQEADITEEQLEKSNEPEFQGALVAKKDAQTHAVEAPPQYRQQEQGILANAQATAEATAQKHLHAMHNTRSQNLNQVAEHQIGAKGKDEQARAKVAGDINKIYEATKTKVEKTLAELDGQVIQAFDAGAADAKKAFEDYVGKRMDDYKSDRYSGFWGPAKWVKDKFAGLPDEVNTFYQEGRDLYIQQMDGVINKVVAIISQGLTKAKAEIASGKQEIQNYVNKLPQDLKGVGQQAAADIDSKFEELQQSVDNKQDDLINTLAQKYKENLDAVDTRIEEMKSANRGLIEKAFDAVVGVIKTIIELTKMLMEVLARVAGVVGQILKDPIGFLGNLIQAVKQGFLNFMNNIGKYLEQGLIGWLTGTMGQAGIQMPENLDLKGIFSIGMQLLGFTYQAIRTQAVKRLGEEKVSRLEQTVEVFQVLASQGIAGMWQFVQDRIGDLNTLIIEPIKNFIIEKVITAGIEWILSLLTPASAFIKAAKAIYEIVKFFIERAQQIADLINAILDAIGAIAAGSLDQAIAGVENALAKSLPVVISFLASLLGLGGIAGKIQSIFQKLRKPVEKAVDWIIDKGANAFKKIGNKFKNSKFGKKVGKLKDAAKEKYKAGKQRVEDKKEAVKDKFSKASNKDKLGSGKDKQSNNVSEKELQTTPKNLVETNPVTVNQPMAELAKEISQINNRTVLYNKGGDPKQTTQRLLSQHKEAKFDQQSGTLTLPPLKASPLTQAKSLYEAAAEIAKQTGVSKITLLKDKGIARLDGTINPTVYGLATYTVPADSASLQPLIKDIEKSANTQHPQKEYFMSICREAAKRHGAKVDFVEVKKPPAHIKVEFEHLTTNEKFSTEISQIYSDNVCPACSVTSGKIGAGGTFSGIPGERKPHNVVSASVFRNTIEDVLKNYGVTNLDLWAKKLIAAGNSPDGPAVTEDKQCAVCEDAQGAWTLMQRFAGKAPSTTPLGNQFQHATSDQLEQFTHDKIHTVVEQIKKLLNQKPGTKDRPITSDIYTQIVALGKVDTFCNNLIAELKKAAK